MDPERSPKKAELLNQDITLNHNTTPIKVCAVSSVNNPSILFSPVPQTGKVFESMKHSESGKMIAFIDHQ